MICDKTSGNGDQILIFATDHTFKQFGENKVSATFLPTLHITWNCHGTASVTSIMSAMKNSALGGLVVKTK